MGMQRQWPIHFLPLGISLSEMDIYSSVSKRLGIPFPVTKVRSYYDEVVDVLLDAVQNHELLSVDRILGLQ